MFSIVAMPDKTNNSNVFQSPLYSNALDMTNDLGFSTPSLYSTPSLPDSIIDAYANMSDAHFPRYNGFQRTLPSSQILNKVDVGLGATSIVTLQSVWPNWKIGTFDTPSNDIDVELDA